MKVKNVQVPEELHARMKARGEATHESIRGIVIKAIEKYMAETPQPEG